MKKKYCIIPETTNIRCTNVSNVKAPNIILEMISNIDVFTCITDGVLIYVFHGNPFKALISIGSD